MKSSVVFQAAGLVLGYPDEILMERLDLIERAVGDAGAGREFAPALDFLRSRPLMEVQSSYVQEFDISRRHALHLTYWTAGDTRRRGEVIAAFKQVYRDSGLVVDLDGELPDYLPMVLEFTATGDRKRGKRLLTEYRAAIEMLRSALERDELPYAGVVKAVSDRLGRQTRALDKEVRTLMAGPPVETVGLGDTTLLPYPQVANRS